jgi:putative hydrolase of the HAD superfamily
MCKPSFIFFDLGQTLVDERDFLRYFDQKFLELLNGFGARIDQRNYFAVRDSIIRDRKIGHGSINELIIEVCRLLSPHGYDTVIGNRIEPQIQLWRKKLFHFFDDAEPTLRALAKHCEMGIIANQPEDSFDLLEKSGFDAFFKVKAISSTVGLKKPDPRIFELAMKQAGRLASECVMVGDRLDTDICPANKLDILTLRTMNSLFALQQPTVECEYPKHTVKSLTEIPTIIENIIS